MMQLYCVEDYVGNNKLLPEKTQLHYKYLTANKTLKIDIV